MGSNMYRRPTMPQTRQAPPPSRPNPAQGCEELLRAIAEADFFAQDLKLYLDTHPRCPEALRMWKNYQAMRQKAASAYIRQYGPIQPLQTDGNAPWAWNQGPWPWEKEAN